MTNTYLKKINPIIFGLIAGLLTFFILFVDTRFENNKFQYKSRYNENKCVCPKLYTTMKVPLIIGTLIWLLCTYLFPNNDVETNLDDSYKFFDNYEIISEFPTF